MRSTLFTLTAALAAAGLTAIAGPASAAGDARCSTLPAQVRAKLAGADSASASAATRRLKLGEQLCRANNERAAAREFQVALKLLGVKEQATRLAVGR
jgi:hypothetical protein